MNERRPLARLGRNLAPGAILTLLALPLLWPLLRDRAFCTHDGNLHFYRLVALRHTIESGLWFSRWTPDLVYGLGFPFFNFRELASYYVPELLVLLGTSVPAALNLVYAAALVLGGWGCWLLARDIWRSEWAGLLAAVAYLAAPYQLLNVYVRGNLPENMALALLPWVWWAFRRLALRGGRANLLAAILSLSALLLIHNISSLLFMPLLLAYLLLLGWQEREQPGAGRRRLLVAAALLTGLALTAFAWFPAIAEKGSVQLYLTHSTRGNDFHYNFASLADMLAPPLPADPTLLNPPLKVQAGLLQMLLALAGLLGAWRPREAGRRGQALFLAAAGLAMLALAMPLSTRLWELIPLLRFVQFPWRLVGRAILPLALLAGAAPAGLARVRGMPAGILAALAALVLAGMPWLYPPACSYPAEPTIASVMDFERNTGLTGVDPLGAYLPRWVAQRPTGSPLEAALRSGQTPRRFDSRQLPAGATLLSEAYGPNRATIEVDSPTAFEARYLTFYFPGWVVRIDGERTAIEPAAETGLITFAVPAGRHRIEVRWALTPLRGAAAAVSLLGLAAGLALLWRAGRGRPDSSSPVARPAPGWLPALALLAAALLAARLAWVDTGKSPLRTGRLVDGQLPGLENPVPVSLADGLELLGYNLTPAAAGEELIIELAWTARQRPTGDYRTRIALVDPAGLVWSDKETYRPAGYQMHPSTPQWSPTTWAWDSHSVPILPGTPPGSYWLQLTVYERDTLAPLNVLDDAGNVAGPSALLGQVMVERPGRPIDELPMQYRWDQRWGDLTLLGGNLDRKEAEPGSPALITFFWRAEAPLPDLRARLALAAPDGATLKEWSFPLVTAGYPTTQWRSGDALMGQHAVEVPGRAENGRHRWLLTVVDAGGAAVGEPVELGWLDVHAPERVWSAPAYEVAAGATYNLPGGEPLARLDGYNLTRSATEIQLTLVWQALAETETSYRVFAHLLRPGGGIVTQSDGVPASWTRPTAGWAPGEFIRDEHQLKLPADLAPGSYQLTVGLYDLAGGRLATERPVLAELELP